MPIRRTATLRKSDVHAKRFRGMAYGALSYGTENRPMPPRRLQRTNQEQLEPALPALSFRHRSVESSTGHVLPPLAGAVRAPSKASFELKTHGTLPLSQVPLSVSPLSTRNLALMAS